MGDYDPMAPNAMRYPRIITRDEIDDMPRLQFNTGIHTNIFLSRERDDCRYFRHGYCYADPEHGGYEWDQTNFDETHFVLKGRMRILVRDAEGREVTLEAAEGEHVYLPGGYYYKIEPTGEEAIFFWTSGPSPRNGVVEAPEYSETLRQLRSEV